MKNRRYFNEHGAELYVERDEDEGFSHGNFGKNPHQKFKEFILYLLVIGVIATLTWLISNM